MKNHYTLKRTVTRKECPWLKNDVPEGSLVYYYSGPVYGGISHKGTAVTANPNMGPFFELPTDALLTEDSKG